jgi:hypothetical protein
LKTKIALYVHSRVQLFLPFLEMWYASDDFCSSLKS